MKTAKVHKERTKGEETPPQMYFEVIFNIRT